MDPNQPQHSQQPPQQQGPQLQAPARKRKKNETNNDDAATPSEPRRLRRSHEACARCRSKKIKASPVGRHRRQVPLTTFTLPNSTFFQCDSKHPRCSACATAGTICHQEDRHRQTLITRGHTERIEHLLQQCDALLKRHIPGFDLSNLDELLAREGIELTANPNLNPFPFSQPSTSRPYPLRADGPPPPPQPHKGYYQPPHPHLVHPGYGPIAMPYGAPPPGSPYPPPHMPIQGHPGPYNPHIHPAFQPPPMHAPPPVPPRPSSATHDIKGQDPKANDMSNTQVCSLLSVLSFTDSFPCRLLLRILVSMLLS